MLHVTLGIRTSQSHTLIVGISLMVASCSPQPVRTEECVLTINMHHRTEQPSVKNAPRHRGGRSWSRFQVFFFQKLSQDGHVSDNCQLLVMLLPTVYGVSLGRQLLICQLNDAAHRNSALGKGLGNLFIYSVNKVGSGIWHHGDSWFGSMLFYQRKFSCELGKLPGYGLLRYITIYHNNNFTRIRTIGKLMAR